MKLSPSKFFGHVVYLLLKTIRRFDGQDERLLAEAEELKFRLMYRYARLEIQCQVVQNLASCAFANASTFSRSNPERAIATKKRGEFYVICAAFFQSELQHLGSRIDYLTADIHRLAFSLTARKILKTGSF